MKKLFISCPMNGRTEENIKKTMDKLHKIAEDVFGEELEVIPTLIAKKPPKDTNERIWYLGQSIQKMAKADYYIEVGSSPAYYPGCQIESHIAMYYNIPSTCVHAKYVMPDYEEIRDKECVCDDDVF